jgi:hypothetical protein
MSNPYINLYKDLISEDEYSGTVVSTGGAMTAPVSCTLDASQASSEIIELAVRCESGFEVNGACTISIVDDYDGHWKLDTSRNGSFNSTSITLNYVADENVRFFAKASSSYSEDPGQYDSAKIRVSALIQAATPEEEG